MRTGTGRPEPGPLATVCGPLELANPVLAASGTFGYGDAFERFWPLDTLGGFVTKTLFLAPREGNPPIRIAETKAGMLNSIGLANVGWDAFVAEKAVRVNESRGSARMLVNIAGNAPSEFREIAARVEADREVVRPDAVEVNVSCPNVEEGGTNIGCHLDQFRETVRGVRDATSLPLFVKLSPNVADVVPFAACAAEEGADGVSLINTLYGMRIDVERRRPVLGTGSGGLSGPAILPVGIHWVYRVRAALPDLPILGIGGIASWEDAVQYLLAGAQAVQVGTAAFVDPEACPKIIAGLERYCASAETTVAALVGAAHRGGELAEAPVWTG
ncbi:MAG: dihydroorotate dehydrogenase [Gemmatimonadota bacterium]|nr:dihydroorotate dehydrogenase [Gemmatimonadota bacterium]